MAEKDRYEDTPEGFAEWLNDKYNTVDLALVAQIVREQLAQENAKIETRQRDDGVWEAWFVEIELDEWSEEGEIFQLVEGHTEAEAVCRVDFGFYIDQGIRLPDDYETRRG